QQQPSGWARIGGAIWEGAKEISGYNDGKACVTEGDLGACAWFAVGIIPGGKAIKGAKLALDAAGTLRGSSRTLAAAARTCRVNSFTGDTPVMMADGVKKPIKDVALNDMV